MALVKAPKRISVEDLRKILGTAKTDEVILGIYGDAAIVRRYVVTPEQIAAAFKIVDGDTLGKAWLSVAPVFRKYLMENARQRGNFHRWLVALDNNHKEPQAAPEPSELLAESRRNNLEKARAAKKAKAAGR